VLTQNYGKHVVENVSCPPNEQVNAGVTFTCTATVDGQGMKVTITVQDTDGHYQVSQPQAQ